MSSTTAAPVRKDVKTLNEDSCRRRREDGIVQLRKAKKEESLSKKRNIQVAVEAVAVPDELSVAYVSNYVQGAFPFRSVARGVPAAFHCRCAASLRRRAQGMPPLACCPCT